MDSALLEPWMLRLDWREDGRPFVLVDLARWPADTPIDPLPPVPVIGIGDGAHPQAGYLDALVEPPVTLDGLAAAIARTPLAAATLVQLLRAAEGLAPASALTAESFAFAMLQGGGEHAAWLAAQTPEPQLPPGALHLRRDDGALHLAIDRPDAHNAIDRAMRDALHEAFTLAALDPSIGRISLHGVGRSFSVGADLSEFGTTRDPAAAHAIRMRTLPALQLLRRAGRFDVHVHGGCVGSGLELAAFADRLTAAPDAWFRLPEVAMGIVPGAGGTVSIPRRIGRQRAALLMLSGKRIGAATALGWGMVDAIVDQDAADQGGADAGGGQVAG